MMQFSQKGDRLYTASFDRTIGVWDTQSGQRLRSLLGHTSEISAMDINFSGTLLISAALDRSCRVWDLDSGRCLRTLKYG